MTPPPRSDPSPPAGECEIRFQNTNCPNKCALTEDCPNHGPNAILELRAALAAVTKERDGLRDGLIDALWQACGNDDGTEVDSLALSSYAIGLRLLAKSGHFIIDSEHGRRVVGRFAKDPLESHTEANRALSESSEKEAGEVTPPDPPRSEGAECDHAPNHCVKCGTDYNLRIAALLRERDELREFVRRFDSWFPLALKDTGRLSESDDWDTDYKKMVEARRALSGSEKEGG